MEWEPRIIAYLCNWCSYAAADNAGAAKKPFPPNIYTVRVMCTGRLDPELLLNVFANGADGVLVCGCHPGDCHYVDGNMRAKARFLLVRRLLAEQGIEPERARLEWVAASEAERFTSLAWEMVEQVRRLGPLGRRHNRAAVCDTRKEGGRS
jgi:coenzyme F420-reducing hydrogenase delta subunit